MGTRHLIAAFYQGEYRIAQYGQWDGYPDGQGLTVLQFARDLDGLGREGFLKKLLAVRDITDEECEAVNSTENWTTKYPHLSRDAGAEILRMVWDGPEGMALRRFIAFAGESLFCEWAYVLDFDKNTLEVFKGSNHSPLDPSERFASIPTDPKAPEYYQVKFEKSWPLTSLPSNEEFLAAFAEPEEEAA